MLIKTPPLPHTHPEPPSVVGFHGIIKCMCGLSLSNADTQLMLSSASRQLLASGQDSTSPVSKTRVLGKWAARFPSKTQHFKEPCPAAPVGAPSAPQPRTLQMQLVCKVSI